MGNDTSVAQQKTVQLHEKTKSANIEKYSFEQFEVERKPFTMVLNHVIQRVPEKNMKAAFLWVYLQSLPETWKINRSHIIKHFGMSASSYARSMSWLKKVGLIDHIQKRNKDGSFGEFRLVVLCGSKFNVDGASARSTKGDEGGGFTGMSKPEERETRSAGK